MISERLRTARRIVLYALVGLVVYVVALMYCFPYNRVKEMAVAMAAQAGFDVEIASAGPAFPMGVSFEDIRVRPRLAIPLVKPIQVRLESARVPFLPIVLSSGSAFEVVVHGLGGRMALAVSAHKGGPMRDELRVDDLNLALVPGLREVWNLPLTGTLHVAARIDSRTGRFADASGEIEFKCATCTLGDGKSAVKFGGANPFLAAGLTLPRVRLGDFGGRVVVEKGVARAQGVAIKSADAELTLDGEVVLRDPLAYSAVNAYVRFKLGDGLLKNASAIASVLQMAGAPGLRPDGFYGLRLSGTFSALSAVLTPTSPLGPGSAPGRLGARSPVVPTTAPSPEPPQLAPAAGEPATAAPSAPPPPPPPEPAAPMVEAPPPPPPPPPPEASSPPPDLLPAPPVRGSPGLAGMMDVARGSSRGLSLTLPAGPGGPSSLPGSPGNILGGALGGAGPSPAGDPRSGPSPAGPPSAPGPPSPAAPPTPPGAPTPPGSPSIPSPPTRGPPPPPPPVSDDNG